MGSTISQGSLGFVNRQVSAPGPPFLPTAADNGLSVDPISARIVLGNDNDFLPTGTAKLLSARKIYLNGNSIHLLDDPGGLLVDIAISAGMVGISDFTTGQTVNLVAGTGGGNPSLFLTTAGSPGIMPLINFDLGGAGSFNFQNNTGNLQAVDTANNAFLSLDQLNDVYKIGDINNKTTGVQLIVDAGAGRIEFDSGGGGNRVMELLPFTHVAQLGDIDSVAAGLILKVDSFTQTMDLRNTALNAGVTINGVLGFTGTVTPVTSITVNGGIVTAVT